MSMETDKYRFPIGDENIYDRRSILDTSAFIATGSWVLIANPVPVAKDIAPQTYGIYYALPFQYETQVTESDSRGNPKTVRKTVIGVDQYGRQCAVIYTPQEVKIFPDEYRILTPERLEEYKQAGWYMQETQAEVRIPLNLDIISRGRALSEDDRETIWALMLDGLTEQQACEEYFLAHHGEYQNTGICYLPTETILAELAAAFG